MILERIKSDGTAHNSYFIGSGKLAAVIDPRRDCEAYLCLAREHGMSIKYVFETHCNEDYLIGSTELASQTGSEIYHGPGSDWKYGNTLHDAQTFSLGKLKVTAIHTPGHTVDSASYTVADMESDGATVLVFTGDTLFVNEVGRCDLYGPPETPKAASSLYDSIFNKLLPMGDSVIICPGHGAGSVCGARIGNRDQSTIGLERTFNPMLQLDRDDFIRHKVDERLEIPHYFDRVARLNLEGPPVLGSLPVPEPLTPAEFKKEMERGLLVDTSEPAAFGGAHIQGAYSIWLEGLPVFAGWTLPYDKPILLVLEDPQHLNRAVRYLIRAGYDRFSGYLLGGTEGWYGAGLPAESLPLLTVHDLKRKLDRGEQLTILDVRGQDEWDSGHIQSALHIHAGHLQQRLNEVSPDREIAVQCNIGHRSGLAASILLRAGFRGVHNLIGGAKAWVAAGYPLVKDPRPTREAAASQP